MTPAPAALLPDDLRVLEARGIGRAQAERQLQLLGEPPPPIRLVRPATVGDGIDRLGAETGGARRRTAEQALAAGRVQRFVPASGAASRMFADWIALAADVTKQGIERFVEAWDAWPFREELEAAQAAEGLEGLDAGLLQRQPELARRVLQRLVMGGAPDGVSASETTSGLVLVPKGLVPFHRIDGKAFTAAQEQLFEASALIGSGAEARVHFTVSADHRADFEGNLMRWAAEIGSRTGVPITFDLSLQDPSTDTLAVEENGELARDEQARPLLRPGGHGSLIRNLAATGGDLVLIKNIDNILPHDRQTESVETQRALVGHLVSVQERLFEHLETLYEAPQDQLSLDRARVFCSESLHLEVSADASAVELQGHLERPVRVCAVVPNRGEPGGGPFWVASTSGASAATSLQIVEMSQIHLADPAQRRALEAATHFNPVLLICALRDSRGRSFPLQRYIDPQTSFVSAKVERGRSLRVLERPGLWNGAMARWITLFVEVPASTFAPVKTVWDLLRPEHRSSE